MTADWPTITFPISFWSALKWWLSRSIWSFNALKSVVNKLWPPVSRSQPMGCALGGFARIGPVAFPGLVQERARSSWGGGRIKLEFEDALGRAKVPGVVELAPTRC
ncbi:MAG: hypothetical protein AMXMBFR33_52160 [Candidatus Xenobia bacterium]